MSALDLYAALPTPARARVRVTALRLAHPGVSDECEWVGSDPATTPDHPALVVALREQWWLSATTVEVTGALDRAPDLRVRELAIVLCAECVAHLSDDPRVAECRRVRLAWVRGEATDEQRDAARDAAWAASWAAAGDAAWAAAGDAAWAAAWDAAWAAAWDASWAALAAPLRTLYPDPCRLDWRDALTRWDVAVDEARTAIKAVAR